jgi:hypothetical protein
MKANSGIISSRAKESTNGLMGENIQGKWKKIKCMDKESTPGLMDVIIKDLSSKIKNRAMEF